MSDKFRNKFRIETTRLTDYDYSSNGAYFITICIDKFKQYFGIIENGRVVLSEIGSFAEQCWREIPDHFSFGQIDEFVIMPNHVHGIIIIASAHCREVACNVSTCCWLYFAGENILSHHIKLINLRPLITKDKLSFIRLLHPFSLLVLLEKI